MSNTIDNRIVSMHFDNKQFETNVATSMSTLDKLKKSLNLGGASKGLEDIGAAAKGCDISPLGSAVETVKLKFSALQIAAVTAFTNIVNSAVNTGKNLVKAFTIDPIKTGLAEYETQINAVQTILSNTRSKGTTLDNVNSALDELNTYADKTIYNFTEMTRNIGTFTAAGVDLNTSVNSIKGIANLAAVSGSTSQQASTAMYQLSQALAAGKVQLMDWNSVVNAGMGGQVFQDALKRTAKHLGHNVDEMIEKYGSFRESLTQGEWLTAEVLTETLTQLSGAYTEADLIAQGYTESQAKEIVALADDAVNAATKVKTATQLLDTMKEAAQSGWTQTWELLIGDFEEARAMWTSVSEVFGDIINASAEARNSMLKGWVDLGGRAAMLDSFKNAWAGIVGIVKPVKEAFREIFPRITSEQLFKITEGVKGLTESFKNFAEKNAPKIYSTFKGLFSILDIGWSAIKDVVGGIGKLISNFTGLSGGILGITASIGDWFSGLRDSYKESDIFGKSIDAIVGFLQKGIDKFKQFASFLKEKIAMPGWEGFLSLMQGIWSVIQKIGGKIGEVATSIGKMLATAFSGGDIKNAIDILNGGLLAGVLLGVKDFFGKFGKSAEEGFGLFEKLKDIGNSIVDIFGSLGDALQAWQQNLKVDMLMKIAGAIGILAASILLISAINPERLASSLGAITVLFGELMGSMAIFNSLGGFDITGVGKAAVFMLGMSTALLILAGALKSISSLSWGELARGLTGVAGLMALIIATSKLMSANTGGMTKGAVGLVIFAAAIKVLASACRDLSSLSWEELGKGLAGVGGLLAAVAIFTNVAKFGGKAISTATGIVILAAAMKILASACNDFGQMKWEEIGKGLASIGGLLLAIGLFTKLTGNAKNVISTSIALIGIGAAMKIFASATKDLSSLSWDEIGRGLAAMAGALAAVTLAMNLMPKNAIGSGAGLLVAASSLIVLSNALSDMGGMSWGEIGRGLAALGGSMLILAVGLKVMQGTLGGSAALLVAAGALAILTPVLTTLGEMSWGGIAKSLITLAGAFAILGVAGLLLGPMVPVLLGLAGAMALFGVGVLVVGAGVAVLAAGLGALAGITAASATAIVAALSIIVTGIASLIPVILAEFGKGIVAFCKVIGESATAIGKAVKEVVLALVDVLVECVPAIADGALKLIAGVLDALASYAPQIIDSLITFLVGVLDGLSARMPELMGSILNLLTSFFSELTGALFDMDFDTILKASIGVGLFAALLAVLGAVAPLIPGAMAGILGIAAVLAELTILMAAFGALAQIPGLQWLVDQGGNLLQSVGAAIGKFIGGIVGGIGGGVLNSFLDSISGLTDADATKIDTFVNILTKMTEVAANIPATGGLMQAITGTPDLVSFSNGLVELGGAIKTFSDSVSDIPDEAAIKMVTIGGVIETLVGVANKMPETGGLAQAIVGTPDMVAFSAGLTELGAAIKSFSDSVGDISTDSSNKMVAISGVIDTLIGVADKVPETGGLAQAIMGTPDLITFSAGLVELGTAITSFTGSLADVGLGDVVKIMAMIPAINSLVAIAGIVPKSGGLAQAIAGAPDLGTFATELKTFGEKIAEFASSVTEVSAGDITKMTSIGEAAKVLVSVASSLSGYNDSSWFNTNLTEFAGELKNFGTKMSEFNQSVTDVNVSKIVNVSTAARVMLNLATSAGSAKTDSLVTFGTNLKNFGKSLSAFYKSLGDIDSGKLSAIATSLSDLASISGDAGAELKSFMDSLGDIGTQGVDAFIKAFDGASAKVLASVSKMLSSASAGVKSGGAKLAMAFVAALSACVTAMNGYYGSFFSAGYYLASGFASGISSGSFMAAARATAMAQAAVSAAKRALAIKSPSRVFIKIGKFVPEGFARGIEALTGRIKNVSTAMANTAIEGTRKAISNIADYISSDVDTQPTIRPVLDLSDVESGAGRINGLFGMQPSIAAMANIGAISSMMNNDQNGSNNDVISAIKDLGRKISERSGDTYTVNGVTYDDGSNVNNAVKSLVRAVRMERRI